MLGTCTTTYVVEGLLHVLQRSPDLDRTSKLAWFLTDLCACVCVSQEGLEVSVTLCVSCTKPRCAEGLFMPDYCQVAKPTLVIAEPVQICLTGVWLCCILLGLNVCSCYYMYNGICVIYRAFFLLFARFKFGKLPQPLCCISVDTDVDI